MTQSRSRATRYLRATALILLGILALVVSALWIWLESSSFDRWLRTQIITALEQRFPVSVSLDRADFEVFGGVVEIENFQLRDRDQIAGPPAIELGKVQLNFSLLQMLREGFHLDELVISQPKVTIIEDPNGRLNIQNMFARPSSSTAREPSSGPVAFLWAVQIGKVEIRNGMVDYQDERVVFDSLEGALSISLQPSPDNRSFAGSFSLSEFSLSIDRFTIPVSQIRTGFTLTENQIIFDQLELKGPAVEALVKGSLDDLRALRYNLDVDLQVSLADLEIFEVEKHVEEGSVQISGHLEGLLKEPLLNGKVSSPLVQVRELPFRNLESEFFLDRDGISFPSFNFLLFEGSGVARGEAHWSRDRTSKFAVNAEQVGLPYVLSYLKLEDVLLKGLVDADLEVMWPGMSLNESEISGDLRFRGALLGQQPSQGMPSGTPIDFDGSSRFEYGEGLLVFDKGFVNTDESAINFSARVGGARPGAFSAKITSQRAEELVNIAVSLGIPWAYLQQRFEVQPSGQVSAELDLEFPSQRPVEVHSQLQIEEVRVTGHRLGKVSGIIHLDADEYRFESIELANPEFTLSGSAWLDRSSPTDRFGFQTEVAKFPSGILFDLLQIEPYLSALVSGQVELERDEGGDLSGRGALRLVELNVPRVPEKAVDEVSTRFELLEGRLRLQDTVVLSPAGVLSGFLDYTFEDGGFSAAFEGSGLTLGRLPLPASVAVEGDLNLRIRGNGTTDRPQISILADSNQLEIDGYSLEDLQLRFLPEAGLSRFSLAGTFLSQPLELTGTVEPVAPFPFKAQLLLSGAPLSPYLKLLMEELPEIEAFLTGRIDAEGSLSDFSSLKVTGDLQQLQLMLRDYELRTAEPVTVTYQDSTVQIPSARFTGEETDFTLRGRFNLKDERSVNLKLVGNSNLRLLNAAIEDGAVEGQLQLETDISGALASPQIVGTANLSRARFVHSDLPLSLWNLQGSLKFTPAQLSLESLSADTELGRIKLDGGVFLESFIPQRWQISAVGTGLRVEYPADVVSTFDMNLNLVKGLSTQLISGRIYLRSSEFTKNLTLAELVLELAQASSSPPRQSERDEISLDISVTGQRSLRIDNNLGTVTASADLTMIGTVGNPVILGNITIDEGTLSLEGNDFDITRGTISFNDPYKTSPYFNFEAETTIREYQITASVRGPKENIRASFNSDPPLSTAGVVSLLATGQTSEEIFGSGTTGQTESGALALYGAGALLSKTLGKELESQTSKLFGLQRFSVDPFIDSGRDRDPGAKITLGAQLSRNVNVTYVSSLGREILGQTVVVQYRLNDRVTLVGTSDSEGSLAIDIKLRKRF